MACGKFHEQPTRLLVVPGLHDSGAAHWQTWLESLNRDALRVKQRDWADPALDRWADRIAATMERDPSARWIVAAHSFGCLALARLAALHADAPIEAALLVAPVDPDRLGLGSALPEARLPFSSTLVASRSDPWLSLAKSRQWAQCWQSHHIDLGDAGHINAESGFGPLPMAQRWVMAMRQRVDRRERHSRCDELPWQMAV